MAFDKLDVKLSVADIDELASAFADAKVPPVSLNTLTSLTSTKEYYSTNYVCWRDFANAVDQVFTQKGLEMGPTMAMTTGIASTGLAAHGDLRGGGAALSSDEQAACDGVLARFKHKLDTRRMTLADWFKVSATTRTSHYCASL